MKWLLGLIVFTASVPAATKSSEIPEKREFPVNSAIDPCADFYQYTCSKVIDSFQLREDRSSHTFSFGDSFERLLLKKKKYIATLIEPKDKHQTEIKNFYAACMNQPARAKEEKTLVADTKRLLNEISSREDLLHLMAKNRLQAEETPVRFFVTQNQDRPLFTDVGFDAGWTTLPEKSYYEKPEVVADLTKMVTKFFAATGSASPLENAKVVVEFEIALAKAKLSPIERRDIFSTRTGISRADLLKNYPNFEFSGVLSRIPKHTHIVHVAQRAMDFLNAKLWEMSVEDIKIIYFYNALVRQLDDAYPEFFNAKFNFESKNFGAPNIRPDRPERCTRLVMAYFTPELDNILWQDIFPHFPREKVVALAEKIRASIIGSLEENKWLSQHARAEAIKKIRTANLQLVAPQSDEEWDFHPDAVYDAEEPIHNTVTYQRLTIEKDLTELKGPISPKRWGMGPLTVNAYYDQSYNKFVLPVGILQYPFFDKDGPLEISLGAIGSVIGHELGHAIDDKGSLYDASGALKTWMKDADLEGLKSRTKILIDQFNNAGQNGELTLGENIGDLVGLTASHRAAFGDKTPKPDVERAFYTQYARMWCEVTRPKFAELRKRSNPHPLGVARVNEQIRQQSGFRRAFQCKDSDPMVLPPEKLVHLW